MRFGRYAAGLLLGAVLVSPVTAHARTQQQDGLEAELTVSSAGTDEQLDARLHIRNTNNFPVGDMSLTVTAPEGYAADGTQPDSIGALAPGSEITLDFTYCKDGIGAAEEGFPVLPAAAAAVAFGGFVIYYAVRSHRAKKLLAVAVCAALGSSYAATQLPRVTAAEVFANHTLSVSESLDLNLRRLTFGAQLSYPFLESQNNSIGFGLEGCVYDAQKAYYYITEEMPALTGTLDDTDGVTAAEYTVADRAGNILLTGSFTPDAAWRIEPIGLVIGENTVTVSVQYEDGTLNTAGVRCFNLNEKNLRSLTLDTGDNDSDGVLNYIERMYGTDPELADSDGDGLSDYAELSLLGTDPLLTDTDGNGTPDGAEDADGDGLTNADEIAAGSDPVRTDTDGDGLTDSEEAAARTAPDKADTDGDGANDGWELRHGFDPLSADADFGGLTVNLPAGIHADGAAQPEEIAYHALLGEQTPGYMGVQPFRVSERAGISVTFEPDASAAPQLYRFDEDTQLMTAVTTAIKDDTAGAELDPGVYMLLDSGSVQGAPVNSFPAPLSDAQRSGSLDIVFVVDHTRSMAASDPNKVSIEMAKDMIGMLRSTDRAAIVQFSDTAETVMHITSDKLALTNALDSIENAGGGGGCSGNAQDTPTDGAAGLRSALSELSGSSATSKYVILLTDSTDAEDISYASVKSTAKSEGIVIHTIGLTTVQAVSAPVLRDIASSTGGRYYAVTSQEGADAGLRQTFAELESLTIERLLDSNNDGITDYDTRLLCSGAVTDAFGGPVFGSAAYEEVQASADLDNDGLANGSELTLRAGENGVYAVLHSSPYTADTDGDGESDYGEATVYHTDPLERGAAGETPAWEALQPYEGLYDQLCETAAEGSHFVGAALPQQERRELCEALLREQSDAAQAQYAETAALAAHVAFAKRLTAAVLLAAGDAMETATLTETERLALLTEEVFALIPGGSAAGVSQLALDPAAFTQTQQQLVVYRLTESWLSSLTDVESCDAYCSQVLALYADAAGETGLDAALTVPVWTDGIRVQVVLDPGSEDSFAAYTQFAALLAELTALRQTAARLEDLTGAEDPVLTGAAADLRTQLLQQADRETESLHNFLHDSRETLPLASSAGSDMIAVLAEDFGAG